MNTNSPRRLALARETVRDLSTANLRRAGGGIAALTQWDGTICSGNNCPPPIVVGPTVGVVTHYVNSLLHSDCVEMCTGNPL